MEEHGLYEMFPNVEKAVVAVVLGGCGQDVEKAIQQLLEISGELEHENLREQQQLKQTTVAKTRDDSGNEMASFEGFLQPTQCSGSNENGSGKGRVWRKPLDDDFLRLPKRTAALIGDQVRQDAILAQMLQNSDFQAELRNHEEFRAVTGSAYSSGDDFDWGEAWNNLSEAAQTKLSALATRFQHTHNYHSLSSSEAIQNPQHQGKKKR